MDDWDKDRLKESDVKKLIENINDLSENSKDKIFEFQLSVSLQENIALTQLILLMREKKHKSVFGK